MIEPAGLVLSDLLEEKAQYWCICTCMELPLLQAEGLLCCVRQEHSHVPQSTKMPEDV